MTVIIGGTYRHYKGNDYKVLGIARHSETEEQLVVYQKMYGDFSWWARPLAMFTEEVGEAGARGPRFTYVGGGKA